MYLLLLTILVLDGLFLGVVILLQSGKGGGLAALGGGAAATEGILGGRQATTVLTRATWTSGTVFMVLALVLAIMSSRAQGPQSILQQQQQQTAPVTQPEPLLPGATDPAGGGDAGEGTDPGGAAGGGATDPGAAGGDPGGGDAGGGDPSGGDAGGGGLL